MRLLLDSCVWGPAAAALREAGHEVVWAGDWSRDPGDEEILARSLRERRVLVALDKDFGKPVIVRGAPHLGVVRLVGFSVRDHAKACHQVILQYEEALAAGALITAEPGRVRVRPGDA